MPVSKSQRIDSQNEENAKKASLPIAHYCIVQEIAKKESSEKSIKSPEPSVTEASTSLRSLSRKSTSDVQEVVEEAHKGDGSVLMEMMMSNAERQAARREELARRAEVIRKRLVVDVLALEWIDGSQWEESTLIILFDKLFPVLVMGLVKVLEVAEKRQLLEKDEPDPNFNPLQFLARFLLRNNPKYGNFDEDNSYVCGLRFVAENLRRRQKKYRGNKLGYLKMVVNSRRKRCELEELKRNQEDLRRNNALKEAFYFWNKGKRIPQLMALNALLSFKNRERALGYDESKGLNLPDEYLNTRGGETFLHVDQFVKYVMKPAVSLSSKQFDDLVDHMEMAGVDFRVIARQNEVTYQLQQLFHNCDVIKIEYLDKEKVMGLLKKFYMRLNEATQKKLNNPNFWPLSDTGDLPDDLPSSYTGKDWMMVDLGRATSPPDDFVLDECPPDNPSVEILRTPVSYAKPYVDFFTNANIKFATLDYQEFREQEMTKIMRRREQMKNLKIFDLEPNVAEFIIPTLFLKDKVELGNKLDILPVWKLRRANALDEEPGLISRDHFCGLLLNFLGPSVDNQGIINKLGVFLVEGCKMKDEEKVNMLYKWRAMREKERIDLDISETFELWDSNASGFLPVSLVIDKIRGLKIILDHTLEFDVMKTFETRFGRIPRNINKSQFKYLVRLLLSHLPKGTSPKDFLRDFVNSYDPGPVKIRSLEAKKQLIHQILLQATYWPHDMRPVFREALSVMKKDDYEISSDRFLSATISLLHRTNSAGSDLDYILTLHAKTSDKRHAELGTYLDSTVDSQSYKAISSKEMIIIKKIKFHPDPYADFWDGQFREEIGSGQMVFVPLMDDQTKVFGVFAVDNLPIVFRYEDEKKFSLLEGRIDLSMRHNRSKTIISSKKGSSMGTSGILSFERETPSVSKAESDNKSMASIFSVAERPWLPRLDQGGLSQALTRMSKSRSMSLPRLKTLVSQRTNLTKVSAPSTRKASESEESIYIREEKIKFFQGIGKAISITLHQHLRYRDTQKCFAEILETFPYMNPSVVWCGVYRVAYDISLRDHILQEMITYSQGDGDQEKISAVADVRMPTLARAQNLYRPFFFACVDSGNPLFGSYLSQNYYTLPIKDLKNQVKFMLVVSIGDNERLSKVELTNLIFYEAFFTKMFHMTVRHWEAGDHVPDGDPVEMSCWKHCLASLCERLSRHLSGEKWYRLACLDDVSVEIRDVFSITLQLLDLNPTGLTLTWREITPSLAGNISRKLWKFNPKSVGMTTADIDGAMATLKNIPIRELHLTNYQPLLRFYEWAMTGLIYLKKYRKSCRTSNVVLTKSALGQVQIGVP